jgi:predicted metalloprotease
MLWKGRRESGNVIDQRSFGGGAGKLGGGALIVGAIITYLMGGNPLTYITQNMETGSQTTGTTSPQDNDRKSFASVVLADTEDVWNVAFQKASQTYQAPQMVLFRGRVQSACGTASTAVGPFYCPGDQRVYLDLSFFDELSNKLGAAGDFAGAYVIAHEVGHHIQNILGLERATRQQQRGMSEREKNQVSVQVELQADCLAGVWAKQTQQTKNVIEEGDIDEALGAASAVGDDKLQQMSRGQVVPDSFTHGSSAQRQDAFRRGFAGGQLSSCIQ